AEQVDALRERGRRAVRAVLSGESTALAATGTHLTTLGPAATLARGYAVVQRVDTAGAGHVLRSAADAPPDTGLRIRVSDGAVHAVVTDGVQESAPGQG
ncbi:MAG: exodeoxyribonuclease VII large subunit, partial [Sciscionella sp.]